MLLKELLLTSYLKFGIITKVTILPTYTNAFTMTSPKLNDLKKELQHLDASQLKDVCLNDTFHVKHA